MNLFLASEFRGLRGWSLLVWVSLFASLALRPNVVQASHLRAGDIQAKIDTTANPNPRRVFFKMILYTDLSSSVKEPSVTIFFGDGTMQSSIPRTTTEATPIIGNNDTGRNVYLFEHTYPASGSYLVSYIGENRNRGVLNMRDSDSQSFYISTRITIDPTLGLNRSPVLNAPAIDKAGTQQVFLHSPAASDADGDSLSFVLRTSQQVVGGVSGATSNNNTPTPVTCTNFVYPDNQAASPGGVQVPYNGTPAGQTGAAAIFVQDVRTGVITWNSPSTPGLYNVAFIVREYRRVAGFRARLIGEVIRDMQITVVATANLRPEITIPADICVVAGTTVTGTVTAVDGTAPGRPAQTAIALFAYGGMLPPATITPIATFTQTASGPPLASGRFVWRTDCNNVAKDPFQVVFKAQDTPGASEPPLIDQKTWRITVVGPPPQGLAAVPSVGTGGRNQVVLTWAAYTCPNADTMFIYRKQNPGTAPGQCVTGIPASLGYTKIGWISPVTASVRSFLDDNNGQGLARGGNYCYRIYAKFKLPAGGESLASAEACAQFAGRAAVLKNVDVDRTAATNGQITIRWSPPVAGMAGATFTSPQYRLLRAPRANPAAADYQLVQTFTGLNDSSYVDTSASLNTLDNQYTYQLEFSSLVGTVRATETTTATSVRTTAVPDGLSNAITVNWSYQVPWDNTGRPVQIFRRIPGGTFTQINTATTTATGGTYTDRDPTLQKFQTYCYYVQTTGSYPGRQYLSSLVNKSQETCVVLNDVPCTPVLSVLPINCDSLANLPEFPATNGRYTNVLRWTTGNTPAGCSTTAIRYRIYYRATTEGPFTLLDSTLANVLTYTHRNLPQASGCYQVQAVAQGGVRSGLSNVACQDECQFFVLPNIFTPNSDGRNDTFRPKNSSPLRSVHFVAYNRWGVKVFENTTTQTVFINWDGCGASGEAGKTAGPTADGVYYYLAEVEFADFANTRRTYKGWVEIVR